MTNSAESVTMMRRRDRRTVARRPILAGAGRAAALALALGVGACESLPAVPSFGLGLWGEKPYKPEVIPDVPADRLYNEGLGLLQRNNFDGAVKKFNEVDRAYPFTEWSRKALVMTAFTHYEAAQYDEAIGASRRFLQLHPTAPEAAYAQYLLAMSYYFQIPDVTRDQERSQRAVQAMVELLERYPKSEYVSDTRFKLQVARDQLAGAEMEVGRFYLTKRNYTGAINRFRDVVSKYQTTRHVEEALMRLTEAYMALGITQEAQTAAAVLGHNFPDSQWYKDSYTLLQSGGLEPRENSGSWISRQFRGFTRTVGL